MTLCEKKACVIMRLQLTWEWTERSRVTYESHTTMAAAIGCIIHAATESLPGHDPQTSPDCRHYRWPQRLILHADSTQTTTFSRRSFSVGGPMAWNSLLDNLRDPSHCSSSFRPDLKTLFSRGTSVFSAIEMLHDIAVYKFTIDIDSDIDSELQ